MLRKEEVKAKQSEIDDLTDKVRSYEADIKRIVKNATFDKTSLEQTTADLKLRLDRTQRELETAREAKWKQVSVNEAVKYGHWPRQSISY